MQTNDNGHNNPIYWIMYYTNCKQYYIKREHTILSSPYEAIEAANNSELVIMVLGYIQTVSTVELQNLSIQ